MNSLEWDVLFLGYLLEDGHVLCVKRALAGVVEHVPCFVYVRVLRAIFEDGLLCVLLEG